MTTIQNKTVSSIDHLSAADIESLGDSSNNHQALVRLGIRQVF